MRYRIQDSLPLEDNTGAVGTSRVQRMVDGRHPEFGPLPIQFENGFTWVDVSENPVSDRLFTLLSQDSTSASWGELAALNARSEIARSEAQRRPPSSVHPSRRLRRARRESTASPGSGHCIELPAPDNS
jgi:hypothetical protein